MAARLVNLQKAAGSIPAPATKYIRTMQQTEVKALTLTIKGEHLDQLISGQKSVEYRDMTDFYIDRFCICHKNGEFKAWKPIKEITFVAGRTKAARRATFAIKRIVLEEWLDENTQAPTGEFTFAIYIGKQLAPQSENI